MTIRGIVLDFDGTFTDVEAEGRRFVGAFARDVADLVGRPIDEPWREIEAKVSASPSDYGWSVEGRVVAPAADPYIRTTAVAQQVFDRFGVLGQPELRQAISQLFYQRAYTHTETVFRPEAKAVLEALLLRSLPIFVVTNARTDVVEKKLGELGLLGRPGLSIHGDAKKYVVAELGEADPTFDGVPATRAVPGLPHRPVYLRRGPYFRTLRQIYAGLGGDPGAVLVVGDIYELDLALPAELGMAVHLVTRPGTPAHEIGAVEALPRGRVSADLGAILGRL